MSRPAPAAEVSSDLLWRDLEPFAAVHRKSAATLLALERALSRRASPAPEERGFLVALAAARGHGAAAFERICSAPQACAFAHRAYDLLRQRQASDTDAGRTLAEHLDGFQLFAAAAALLAGADWRLPRPLALSPPVALPGTALVLRGAGSLRVHGASGGALEISTPASAEPRRLPPGGRALGAELAPAPVASHSGLELVLGAESLELPGVEPAEELAAVPGPDWARERAAGLAQALALIEQYQPALFDSMRLTLRAVALKPGGKGDFQGISFSDFPGACIVSFSPNPYVLADSLIHEFHHNRLFAIENGLPLVEAGADAPIHASPFRPDPRPVRGLLHGLYVFVGVWRFWNALRGEPGLEPLLAVFTRDRVLRVALNLVIGRRQLEATQQGLSDAGRAVLALLAAEVERALAEIERADLPLDGPAAFCGPDGRIRLEVSRAGQELTVADALAFQLRHFAASERAAAGS